MQGETGVSISLDRLGKRYGTTWVLRDLSFHVPPGALCVVCGPPGAGKTTLLRLMVGLERPDEGNIRVEGFDAWEDRSILRYRTAFVPERFGTYPHLTVAEYFEFFEASYAVPLEQRSALREELLELVDLQERRDAYIDDLGPDQKHWLGLARGLVHDPDVVVLDEPMRNMSPAGVEEMVDMLQELAKLGKSVVVSAAQPLENMEEFTHIDMVQRGDLVLQTATGMVVRP